MVVKHLPQRTIKPSKLVVQIATFYHQLYTELDSNQHAYVTHQITPSPTMTNRSLVSIIGRVPQCVYQFHHSNEVMSPET